MASYSKNREMFVKWPQHFTFRWSLTIIISTIVATGIFVYHTPHQRIAGTPVEAPQRFKHHRYPRQLPTPIYEAASTTTTRETPTTTPATTTTASTTPVAIANTITSTLKEEKKNIRLPRALKPLHYLVKLQPFINGNFSILGYVEVEMEVLEPTLNITLHIVDIITKNETIRLIDKDNQEGAADLVIKKHEYDNEREFYVAHLEEALQQGHKYILSMEFTGFLNDNLRGFYRSTYRDAAGNLKFLAVTQFQATDARRAFPCFDEPGLKATFEVYLAREANMTSISNMPINNTFPVEGQEGWLWDQFQVSVPMSTYLVAFVVSDFAHLNATDIDHIQFRVWAREEALTQAQYALRVGPALLTHFEDYFNQPYPLPKQDMIAIPDFSAGAMENWGLITYRETALLYDPDESARSSQYGVALTVAHELAHQWFGNIVTPKWWTDLWLNEGFATFVQYIGLDHEANIEKDTSFSTYTVTQFNKYDAVKLLECEQGNIL
ncbi:aminopeptidase N-like [Cherax quadricarinatus]|uniref:aminopeptidase N-like n=1 Tax=Cherax quadricarinatus TaxID=27406 RepID=UPI00387E8CF5